uniref:Ig-like domain-containing protein n=1 Tax=Gouania willdenowi TaxID=441366 RepID=A0A8C5DNP2_GOUWI
GKNWLPTSNCCPSFPMKCCLYFASVPYLCFPTGATIPANTKHSLRFEVFNNGTLVLRNIQLQDRGQYLCTAQNRFGSDRMVITLAVQTEAPKIQQPKSTEIAVYVGKTVTLECLASGKPPAQISWILPDRTFIHSANFSSKGDYKCIASNAAGADTITYHLHVAALPPSISEGATDTVNIPAGTSMFVHCSVKGKPEPALRWMLPSGIYVKPSQFVGRRLFVFPNGTLYVKNVLPNDSGRYRRMVEIMSVSFNVPMERTRSFLRLASSNFEAGFLLNKLWIHYIDVSQRFLSHDALCAMILCSTQYNSQQQICSSLVYT